jgi:hypothetical protein
LNTISTFQQCTTKKHPVFNSKNVEQNEQLNTKILYLIDGKEITKEFLKTIEPSNIKSMYVLKGKKEISRHTHQKVAGIIIIKLKKQP